MGRKVKHKQTNFFLQPNYGRSPLAPCFWRRFLKIFTIYWSCGHQVDVTQIPKQSLIPPNLSRMLHTQLGFVWQSRFGEE